MKRKDDGWEVEDDNETLEYSRDWLNFHFW